MKGSNFFRSENSQILNHSFENSRVSELETIVEKLKEEIMLKEDRFGRELRQANLNLTQLTQKLKAVEVERELAIESMKAKMG